MNLNNTPFTHLGKHLLDLLHALEGQDIPLLIVGGFGLALRHQHLQETLEQTLLTPIPNLRSTEDIDTVLRLDLLANIEKMTFLSTTLTNLGYQVVPGAEKYQFVKPQTATNASRNIKIDLMARKPSKNDPQLPHDQRRVKPKEKDSPLHAHITPEAIAVEDLPFALTIEGNQGTSTPTKAIVYLPHPYALMLLKLFAFQDEQQGKKPGDRTPYARKHAGDLYVILAMTTETEYASMTTLKYKYHSTDVTNQAAQIVHAAFQDQTSTGAIRIREAHPDITLSNLMTFLKLLNTIFE